MVGQIGLDIKNTHYTFFNVRSTENIVVIEFQYNISFPFESIGLHSCNIISHSENKKIETLKKEKNNYRM